MQVHNAGVTIICDTCHKRIVTRKMNPDGSMSPRRKLAMERAIDKHQQTPGPHQMRAQISAVM